MHTRDSDPTVFDGKPWTRTARGVNAAGDTAMRALRKGQAGLFALHDGIVGEAWLVERAFGLGPCALTDVMALLHDRLASAEI